MLSSQPKPLPRMMKALRPASAANKREVLTRARSPTLEALGTLSLGELAYLHRGASLPPAMGPKAMQRGEAADAVAFRFRVVTGRLGALGRRWRSALGSKIIDLELVLAACASPWAQAGSTARFGAGEVRVELCGQRTHGATSVEPSYLDSAPCLRVRPCLRGRWARKLSAELRQIAPGLLLGPVLLEGRPEPRVLFFVVLLREA